MSKFKNMINGSQPVLVDFYATWCGPCKSMVPVIKDLKSEIGTKAKIVKVDIDKNPRAAQAYGVRSVPTFIVFKNGRQTWRQSGAVSKSVLKNAIERA